MIKNNRGVALATLVIAVAVMIVIAGTITYTSLDSIKLRRLDDMYNDIRLLKQKVTEYYIENEELPVLSNIISKEELLAKTENNLKFNVNDNNEYKIIDLDKLGGITLKYGKEYKQYSIDEDKVDLYIINETSHTIYYLKGIDIKLEGIEITKYALEETFAKIDLNIPEEETELFTYTYNSDSTAILTGVKEGVTLPSECTIPTETVNEGTTYTVSAIGNEAFAEYTELTTITIPESVTSIGESAFFNCTGLTNIEIPSKVTKISASTFEECSNLTNVTMSASVTDIESCAFYGCSSLSSIILSESLVSIGDDVFCNCVSLENITFPSELQEIGVRAFLGCSNLARVSLPNSVGSIGSYAFYECSRLSSISIPSDGMTILEDYVFYGCSSLTSVRIPELIESIGNYAFSGCSNLKDVVIEHSHYNENCMHEHIEDECIISYTCDVCDGEKVTYEGCWGTLQCNGKTGDSHFDYCPQCGYSESYLGEDVCYAGSDCPNRGEPITCTNCDENGMVYDLVCEIIDGECFCSNKKSIGIEAFSNCINLETIKIPGSVTSIGKNAFYNCDKLTIQASGNSAAYYYAPENGINFELIYGY